MGESPQGQAGGGGVQQATGGESGGTAERSRCVVCGEPRGAISPCPHCGMD